MSNNENKVRDQNCKIMPEEPEPKRVVPLALLALGCLSRDFQIPAGVGFLLDLIQGLGGGLGYFFVRVG
jgi:hypothetical protein